VHFSSVLLLCAWILSLFKRQCTIVTHEIIGVHGTIEVHSRSVLDFGLLESAYEGVDGL